MDAKELTVAENLSSASLESEKTIEKLTAEIQYYLVQMGQNAIEIGKRLIFAKAKLSHGEWQNWLEDNFNLSYKMAAKFMQVAERFSKVSTSRLFSQSQMFEMLSLPESETEKFIEVRALEGTPVASMSIKKLREEIKKYKSGLSESNQEKIVDVEVAENVSKVQTLVTFNESEKIDESTEKVEMTDVDLEIQNNEVEKNLEETSPLESLEHSAQEKNLVDSVESFGNFATSQLLKQSQSEIPNDSLEKEEVSKGVEDLEKFLTLMNLLKNNKNLRKVVEIYAAKDVKEFEKQLGQLSAFNSELKNCLTVLKKQQDKNMSRKAIIAALKQIALADAPPFDKSKFIRDSVEALGFESVHNTPTKELLKIFEKVKTM